ncbi:MAG TPA: hypothetical protein VF931_12460 [Steroidobacteraceae bacterium]
MRNSGLRICQLLALGVALLASSGCSWFHHGSHAKCREPIIGAGARNLPPLQVPAGLDAPDTRNAIKIPPLSEPERPRNPQDPCLSRPPSYKG